MLTRLPSSLNNARFSTRSFTKASWRRRYTLNLFVQSAPLKIVHLCSNWIETENAAPNDYCSSRDLQENNARVEPPPPSLLRARREVELYPFN
ncbi:hypothetical protein CEXT_19451 [Caerostris extrusa]|uniref:Uncharacterized protein n=1 Tax=Caerostris extrusa TaxID=172846 RepID=A0AAV4Y8C5_CAEEX|nr:hypothetical protein CEXT_19451 [Caerostris extrusa]